MNPVNLSTVAMFTVDNRGSLYQAEPVKDTLIGALAGRIQHRPVVLLVSLANRRCSQCCGWFSVNYRMVGSSQTTGPLSKTLPRRDRGEDKSPDESVR